MDNINNSFAKAVFKRFLIIYALFAISFCAAVYIGMKFTDIAEYFTDIFQQIISNNGIAETEGLSQAISLMLNNGRAGLLCTGFGFIPFLFIPVFIIGFNAFISGYVLSFVSTVSGVSALKMFVYGILPHGIFEITALVLSAALGTLVCGQLIKLMMKKQLLIPFEKLVARTFITFGIICVPLFIIAGFIEALITPILISFV